MSIDHKWEKVKNFHVAFNHPNSDKPKLLCSDRVEKRYKWMKEEIDEFAASKTIEEQADAMIDLIYFALGTLVEMGVKPDKLFDIVHEANMSKLWEDGTPRYNSDGKVVKPSTWADPEPKLQDEILRQINTNTSLGI